MYTFIFVDNDGSDYKMINVMADSIDHAVGYAKSLLMVMFRDTIEHVRVIPFRDAKSVDVYR